MTGGEESKRGKERGGLNEEENEEREWEKASVKERRRGMKQLKLSS